MKKSTQQIALIRWITGYGAAIATVVLLTFACTKVASSYYALSPRVALEEWACYGKPGSKESWELEQQNLLKASQFDPWNADLYMDMGKMYEWRALSGSAWSANVKESRQKAMEYFLLAAENRPTWALAWVNYAQSKLLNRKIDDDFYNALANGFRYGRWQADTQKKLLWLSIGIWKKLPDDLKGMVRDQIRAMLTREYNIRTIVPIALRFQWFDELDPLVTKQKDIEYVKMIRSKPKEMRKMLGGGKPKQFVCRVAT